MRIMTQIIKGFKCLHENNIVHRDLKPANILLHDSVAKVGDFGFSKLTEGHDQLLLSLVGTPQYMSPQILSGTHYTEKTDIWSLGIILYQMLFGRVPWDAAKDVDTLVKHIQQQKVRIPEVPKISRATAYLIEHMLQYEEASRIGWWELFSYDFYGGKESREETLSREVKSLSINSSESLEEKSFNYAKIYFQCSKMILDTNELRRRSITNNDLVKTIVSGYGSREIEPRSKNYHT
jgi:serine/threonine protein kinase